MLKHLFFTCIFGIFSTAALAQDYDGVAQHAAQCRKELNDLGLLGGKWRYPPWECSDPVPRTLKKALDADALFVFGAGDPARVPSEGGNSPACAPLKSIGWDCDYNVRVQLVQFLAMYGKVLFPQPSDDSGWPDNFYSGQADQNRKLIAELRKNIGLFRDGDLTAEEVQDWR